MMMLKILEIVIFNILYIKEGVIIPYGNLSSNSRQWK